MVGCFRIAVYLFNHVTEEHEIGMSSKSFQKARKASSCVKAGKTIWSEQIFLTFEKFWCSLSYIKAQISLSTDEIMVKEGHQFPFKVFHFLSQITKFFTINII